MLTVTGLSKSYATPSGEKTPVFTGVTFALAPGETAALMGESGSGKSTLLHVIAGLEPADAGGVSISGRDMTAAQDSERAALRRETVGIVFQQFNLIPSLTVAANLAFSARLSGKDDRPWRDALAERLGLAPLLTRYPEELSGGQQQRLAIGRALASRPALLLADEPTGALDAANSDAVLALALELAALSGAALLVATHSDKVAAGLGRRLRLENGRLSEASSRPEAVA